MFSQTSMNLSKTPSPNTSPIVGALANNNQCMLITRKYTNSRIGEVNFVNHDEDITPLSIAHSKKSNIIATINWKKAISHQTPSSSVIHPDDVYDFNITICQRHKLEYQEWFCWIEGWVFILCWDWNRSTQIDSRIYGFISRIKIQREFNLAWKLKLTQ